MELRDCTCETKSYEEWFRLVDRCVTRLVGLSVHDLADFCSRDLYEAGDNPVQAAKAALAGDDMMGMFGEF